MKINIRLNSAEMVEEFLQVCSSFKEDINIVQGSKIYDAKSLMILMNLDFARKTYVQIISNSHTQQIIFAEKMQPFKEIEA